MSTNPSDTLATLNGNFKEVYAPKIANLIPESIRLTRKVGFEAAARLGNLYHQPVDASGEAGFTHEATGAGAFALLDPVAMQMLDAQVNAQQVVLRSAIDYEAAAKSVESKAAFVQATKHIVKHMKLACDKRGEVLAFYGASGLGKVDSTSASSSDLWIVFTEASFAPGVWIGSKNTKLDIYNGASKINSNAAVVVKSVDIDNHRILVSGNATDLGNIAGTHDVFYYGAYGKEMIGLDKMITNTGTLFNIDASTYADVWQGSSLNVSGNLTLGAILEGVSKACNRGLDGNAEIFVSNKTFSTLASDQASLRKYDASYDKTGTNGFQFIKFWAQNGSLEVIPTPMVKQGEAFLAQTSEMKRIGSTDTTFNLPGMNEQFFLHLPAHAGYELRAYSSWQLFNAYNARSVKFYGITNTQS